MKKTFEIEPQAIAYDIHPGYLSTNWALGQGLPLIGVQHHHAHIAACMGDHSLQGQTIGIALDGTGYGTDGKVWGGEVLIASYTDFERFGHLRYVAMPGSSAAIHQPWRMAFGHLLAALGEDAMAPEIRSELGATEKETRLLARMVQREVNSPLTSSCGRLFDAAAALITGRRVVDYEAQAAIELEGLAVDIGDLPVDGAYPITLVPGDPWQLDPATMWLRLLEDKRSGVNPAIMAVRFHAGVAAAYSLLAERARTKTGIAQVCLSGGVFHNALLHRMLHRLLVDQGFQVFAHRNVSPGDGGLSYGQAVVAAARSVGGASI